MKKFALIFSLFFILFLVGCSEQSVETITDPDNKPEVPKVEVITSEMIVYHYMYDSMDRGNHDFFDKDVVINSKYYEKNEIKRGDIIAVKTPRKEDGEYLLYRVIALPSEKVKIRKAQIYIDGNKLDTFYGGFHRAGSTMEQYMKANSGKVNETDYDMKEVKVKENEIFLVGDDWLRGGMYMESKENIAGKVLGYK